MSNNFRIVDLPNFTVIQRILQIFVSTLQLDESDGVFPVMGGVDIHNEAITIGPLVDSLKSIGLYDSWVATSLVLTYNEIPVHKDNAHEFDYSLNLPILNTENTYTSFYNVTQPPVTKYLPNGLPYDVYEKEYCEVIDTVEINAPTLLNVKVPHGVMLGGGQVPRVTLALRINNVYENLFGEHIHLNGTRR
jgi:hypothetical protein